MYAGTSSGEVTLSAPISSCISSSLFPSVPCTTCWETLDILALVIISFSLITCMFASGGSIVRRNYILVTMGAKWIK